jgi:hypothetical protein
MWTPAALSSELKQAGGDRWRFVEDQHRISTMRLVDTLDEQAQLEELLDATKPPMPAECRHLHYLLFTPFRYRPAGNGSRFRRRGDRRGVLYAAESVETALHEVAFYRLLFLAESPGMLQPERPTSLTAFCFPHGLAPCLDLTSGALAADRARWEALSDYAACQALADAAREAGADAIRYASVRHAGGFNWAILTCRHLAAPHRDRYRQWFLLPDRRGVTAWTEHPERAALRLEVGLFAGDGRLAGLAG